MHAARPNAGEFRGSSNGPSDREAIDEVLRGNREMFEVIVRRYNARLYRVGMAYLRNHAQVEDAMQNAYIKCFHNLGRFEGGAAFSTWLTRIMINECLMLIRRAHSTAWESFEDIAPFAADPAAPLLRDSVQLNEMRALLEAAIVALPQRYRAVYILREVQQLNTAETAECLGISEQSAKVLLHRARARLKDALLSSAAGVELFPYSAEFCQPMTERVLGIVLQRHSHR